jgi:hypothetical protein
MIDDRPQKVAMKSFASIIYTINELKLIKMSRRRVGRSKQSDVMTLSPRLKSG